MNNRAVDCCGGIECETAEVQGMGGKVWRIDVICTQRHAHYDDDQDYTSPYTFSD